MKEHKYSATPHPWHYMQMKSLYSARPDYSTHWIGIWVSFKTSLDTVQDKKQKTPWPSWEMLTQLYLLIFGNMKLTKMKTSTTPGRSTTGM